MYNNLGILLYKEGDVQAAGENLLEAFKMLKEKKLDEVGHNCAAYCRYVLNRPDMEKAMLELVAKHKDLYNLK